MQVPGSCNATMPMQSLVWSFGGIFNDRTTLRHDPSVLAKTGTYNPSLTLGFSCIMNYCSRNQLLWNIQWKQLATEVVYSVTKVIVSSMSTCTSQNSLWAVIVFGVRTVISLKKGIEVSDYTYVGVSIRWTGPLDWTIGLTTGLMTNVILIYFSTYTLQ